MMKTLLTLLALIGSVSIFSVHAADPPPATEASEEESPQLTTLEDPVLVFQKAFWRRPQAGDEILHAERREWLNTSGNVTRWQWFLVVDPSPETQRWLATNPFFLSPVASAAVDGPPEWFPADLARHELHRSSGNLLFARPPDDSRLYVTDSGAGFAPANAP